MTIEIELWEVGKEVTAKDVSEISGVNQVKGIHPIKKDEQIEGVAILCTLFGDNYKNEWISENYILKYFLESKNGIYKEEYVGNRSIINSKNNYNIYAFIRNSKKEKFKYAGIFKYEGIDSESDGAKYFVLSRRYNLIEEKEISIGSILENLDTMEEVIEEFPEGKKKYKVHSRAERNPRVIEAAKKRFKQENGKVYCEACGFDFEKVYGEIGQDYIEGHHIKPVSEMKAGETTSVNDIVLLCSNCHKMVHRRRPWLSHQDIKEILK